MALSSIFEDIIIESKEDAERFIDALEKSQQDEDIKATVDVTSVEDEEDLGALLDRILERST